MSYLQLHKSLTEEEQIALFSKRGTEEWAAAKWELTRGNVAFLHMLIVRYLRKQGVPVARVFVDSEELGSAMLLRMPRYIDYFDDVNAKVKLQTFLGKCITRDLRASWLEIYLPMRVNRSYYDTKKMHIQSQHISASPEIVYGLADHRSLTIGQGLDVEELREAIAIFLNGHCTQEKRSVYQAFTQGMTLSQYAKMVGRSRVVMTRVRQQLFDKLAEFLADRFGLEAGEYNPHPRVTVQNRSA